jgi:hypothetical protein
MKKMFTIAALALATLAASQSAQAFDIDGDGNFVPGAAYIQTARPTVVLAYTPAHVTRQAVAPWDAFAAVVAPARRSIILGTDSDGNPVPGGAH